MVAPGGSMLGRKISSDARGMRVALALARLGASTVFPNPAVGALVVRDGQVVGYGWHRRAGGDHAEVEAIAMAGELARRATLYVTLEPCNHHGKTPPCTDAILRAGLARVVVGIRDPNPLVTGGGAELLQKRGIEVVWSALAPDVADLDLDWLTRVAARRRPAVSWWVPLRLDGTIGPLSECVDVLKTTAVQSRIRRFLSLGGIIALSAEERSLVDLPAEKIIVWEGALEEQLSRRLQEGVRHIALLGGGWVASLNPSAELVDKVVALHLPSFAAGAAAGAGIRIGAWQQPLHLQRAYRAAEWAISVYRTGGEG